MKWIVVAVICLTGCSHMSSHNSSDSRLPPAGALRYAQAYARFRHLPMDRLRISDNGAFFGRLEPLDFEYFPDRGELLLRGVVINNATMLGSERNGDMRAELDRIGREEPNRVAGGTFELIKLPWEEYPHPELYLRKEIRMPDLSEAEFLRQAEELSKAAYQWHRLYFQQLADRVIQSRK